MCEPMNNNTISVTICVDTDKLNNMDEIEKEVEDKIRDAAKELIKSTFPKRKRNC